MFTRVKTAKEVEAMRTSGKMLASILQHLSKTIESGMCGKDAAAYATTELKALGGKPSFLGYYGFPDVLCVSVNDEVVHGIPNSEAFKEGDLVSFDFGVTYNGMITDSAFSMFIGGKAPNSQAKELLDTTEQSLYAGIERLKDGVRVGDIASAIQDVLEKKKLGIVRELVGHGVGHKLHEDPNIPNYGSAGTGPMLKKGMTIAIEPMATLGDHRVTVDDDGWTVRTADGSLAAHFEHTILLTPNSYEILTSWDN